MKEYDIKNGLIIVMLNDKWGLMNKDNEEIIPCIYDHIFKFEEGIAPVSLNGKMGFINTKGEEIIPCKYIYNSYNTIFHDGLSPVRVDNKFGYINKKGEEIIPLKYDMACYFREGLASVNLNDKWGFINTKGEEVVPLIYENALFSFDKKILCVRTKSGWGTINKDDILFDKEDVLNEWIRICIYLSWRTF